MDISDYIWKRSLCNSTRLCQIAYRFLGSQTDAGTYRSQGHSVRLSAYCSRRQLRWNRVFPSMLSGHTRISFRTLHNPGQGIQQRISGILTNWYESYQATKSNINAILAIFKDIASTLQKMIKASITDFEKLRTNHRHPSETEIERIICLKN